MVVGNLFALPQTDARRLLGFSGVAQMGYVLLGVGAIGEVGAAMTLFFLATYVFTNLGAFLVVHAAAQSSGSHDLDGLRGLSSRAPGLAAALLCFLLSLVESGVEVGGGWRGPTMTPALKLAIGLCLAAVVGFGLWPGPLVESSARAAHALLSHGTTLALSAR